MYGEKAADQLYGLLGGHYGGIREYMQANFARDRQGQDAAAAPRACTLSMESSNEVTGT